MIYPIIWLICGIIALYIEHRVESYVPDDIAVIIVITGPLSFIFQLITILNAFMQRIK